MSLRNTCIVLGGDWNAVWDRSPVDTNIDVINMLNVPSTRRTDQIHALCDTLNLTDPYRIIYPHAREYTFTPHGINQHNRSRLDFFLISKDITDQVKNVTFDHKSVTLLLSNVVGNFKFFIKDNHIQEEEFGIGIHAAVIECYLIHCKTNPDFKEGNRTDMLRQIGSILQGLSDIHNLKLQIANTGPTRLLNLQIEGKKGEIREICENLPPIEFFDALELDPDPDIFFETLVLCIKNNALLEQNRYIKIKHVKKKWPDFIGSKS